jgi:hypothetical protein
VLDLSSGNFHNANIYQIFNFANTATSNTASKWTNGVPEIKASWKPPIQGTDLILKSTYDKIQKVLEARDEWFTFFCLWHEQVMALQPAVQAIMPFTDKQLADKKAREIEEAKAEQEQQECELEEKKKAEEKERHQHEMEKKKKKKKKTEDEHQQLQVRADQWKQEALSLMLSPSGLTSSGCSTMEAVEFLAPFLSMTPEDRNTMLNLTHDELLKGFKLVVQSSMERSKRPHVQSSSSPEMKKKRHI